MAARAQALGVAGVVVDGRFRDIGEIREMGLPVRSHFSILILVLFSPSRRVPAPFIVMGGMLNLVNPKAFRTRHLNPRRQHLHPRRRNQPPSSVQRRAVGSSE